MNKLEVDTISIYKGKDDVFNLHSDRISIWGNRGGMTFPLVYITKPKSVVLKIGKLLKKNYK